MTLRTYTGGYQRFENDHYMGGNPWVISNLWMANYYLETGENKKARECFDFVLKTCGMHGYLSEQIDNNQMAPAWVIGLGWSPAMFIIILEKVKSFDYNRKDEKVFYHGGKYVWRFYSWNLIQWISSRLFSE